VAVAECCILGGIGLKGGWKICGRLDAALFGEEPSRFVVSVAPAKAAKLKKEAAKRGVRLTKLGEVGGTRLSVEGLVSARLEDLRATWYGALERALRGAAER
jgi:phosphoribosylformylglycinamidine synthase